MDAAEVATSRGASRGGHKRCLKQQGNIVDRLVTEQGPRTVAAFGLHALVIALLPDTPVTEQGPRPVAVFGPQDWLIFTHRSPRSCGDSAFSPGTPVTEQRPRVIPLGHGLEGRRGLS